MWYRRLLHVLMPVGHLSSRNKREREQPLSMTGRVQPARRTGQGERLGRTITGTQRSPCGLTQLPGFHRNAHDRTQIAPAARAYGRATPWGPAGWTAEYLAHPSST